jgi:mRNA interferase MazF
VQIAGRSTRVLAEQSAAVDPSRLGARTGSLTFDELRRVDAALRLVLDL